MLAGGDAEGALQLFLETLQSADVATAGLEDHISQFGVVRARVALGQYEQAAQDLVALRERGRVAGGLATAVPLATLDSLEGIIQTNR